ncbi:hypothetical protein [Tenacibaculum mesophilum]|uniref:hypothetical protein n=1 Tax=Tenacibaculum mesophilum TaxID=104268 RepID=UPI002490458A|nr:hypothetical protein [Tenacibaculum mesophilum]
MEIEYKETKGCSVYKNLMSNPTDRKAIKKFNKEFNQTILGASIKTHQKLESSSNAFVFNQVSSKNNKIEVLSGVKKKAPAVLKVRIQGSYRKFFHFYQTSTFDSEFCIVENWVGQFKDVSRIHVFEINKHDYSKVG